MLTCPHCSTPLNGGVCPSCGYVDPSLFVLKPGTKLQKGKYTVGKVLGQGGFGITYKGSNQFLKTLVAIKEFFPEGCSRAQDGKTVIPNPNFAQDFNKWKQKFLKEAQILAKLNHPSIVKVLDYFEENNTAYMVMEFLKGQTLESYIQSKGGRLSEKEALELIKQIAEAVKFIHSKGILHRDLKPDNIILTDDGRIVLIDFGNAKDFNSSTLRTSSTTAVLTPGYGAPEQYSPKEEKGPYTDIYALGAILYRMLTGQIPTEADTRLREMLNTGKDSLVPPRRLNSSISENVEKVILKALNLKKKDRYQSVDKFLKDLEGKTPGIIAFFNKLFGRDIELQIGDEIRSLVIKKGQKVVLENSVYKVYNDIEIKPGGELIIKNATLKFEKEAGIIGKDCIFIAENSKFIPLDENEGWKNITIGGKIKGYIKSCTFINGRGRLGKFYNQTFGVNLQENYTMGGGLFVYSTVGNFLISDSSFKECKADFAGGVDAKNSTIENCTFDNCSASSWGGGGVYAWSSTIENCTFDKCSAWSGGGIYAKENVQIENCTFDKCSASIGGGVDAEKDVQIENCTFDNCSASWGGGVDAWENVQIENCTFDNCSASVSGSGVYAKHSTIENCTFDNCSASWGGGVYAEAKVTIVSCTFKKCQALRTGDEGGYGGGIWAKNSTIQNCFFEVCSANSSGGGIDAFNSKIEICTFNKCSASHGGGIWAKNSTIQNCALAICRARNGGGVKARENVTVVYCTFDNCKANYGGGIWTENSTIQNCTFNACSAKMKGGCIYCEASNNQLEDNTFTNCTPDNLGGNCKKGGCYITTATFKALKTQNDKCEELELFRWYRDNILAKEADGKKLIEEYYQTAPLIVEKINSQPNAEEIYQNLWENYLKPCLEYLEKGEYQKIKTLYVQMVRNLQKEFLEV